MVPTDAEIVGMADSFVEYIREGITRGKPDREMKNYLYIKLRFIRDSSMGLGIM
jgi:hypothetical protein